MADIGHLKGKLKTICLIIQPKVIIFKLSFIKTIKSFALLLYTSILGTYIFLYTSIDILLIFCVSSMALLNLPLFVLQQISDRSTLLKVI